MEKTIIAEGKTTNEAIENGLKQLKTTKSKVEIKVLESEDKRSFFSILAPRVVKVEITLKVENNKTQFSPCIFRGIFSLRPPPDFSRECTNRTRACLRGRPLSP